MGVSPLSPRVLDAAHCVLFLVLLSSLMTFSHHHPPRKRSDHPFHTNHHSAFDFVTTFTDSDWIIKKCFFFSFFFSQLNDTGPETISGPTGIATGRSDSVGLGE